MRVPFLGIAMMLADQRKEYTLAGLSEKDLAKDPFRQFERWFQEAEAAKIPEANSMVLSTSDADGRPSARVVLLKGVDGRGFVFYTNYESRKGRALDRNPVGSLLFAWLPLERQVIVEGPVAKVAREESETYFHSRPRMSQLGAWAAQPEGRREEVRGARGPAAAHLGRLPALAGDDRVLAGAEKPPSRPAALPAGQPRGLGGRAACPLNALPHPPCARGRQ